MISKEEIIEKVGVLLKELNDKFEYISNPNEDVNPLEFQLFEINAAYFAEHTNLLRKLEEEYSRDRAEQPVEEENLPIADQEVEPTIFTPASISEAVEEETLDSQETVEEIQEEDRSQEEGRSQEVVEEEASEAVNNKSEEEENEPEEVEAQSKPEPEPAPVFDSTPVSEPTPESNSVSEREVESTSEEIKETTHEVIIEEKTLNVQSERPMSLNERLSEQRKAMDSEKQHLESPRRIKDIKAGINLNDKLMFIKDLFNGYSLAYSEAIELLNRFESFEDADRFLKTNYAQKNSWDTKQASVEKLYAILRQRYG